LVLVPVLNKISYLII